MFKLRPLANRVSTLCCAWPLLTLQLPMPPAPVPFPLSDEEQLVLPGVVLEEIPEDSALKRAGLQPGDVILRWERLPNPPANPEGTSGVIESPFDWMWLEIEQAPRGVVRLWGERKGAGFTHDANQGQWGAAIKPVLLGRVLEEFERAKADLEAGSFERLRRLSSELVVRQPEAACFVLLDPYLRVDGQGPPAKGPSKNNFAEACHATAGRRV